MRLTHLRVTHILDGLNNELKANMINTKAFCAALRFAAHAHAKADIRYYLKGVLFEFAVDRLTLVGCDGVRMAVAGLPCLPPFDGSFIISTDSVKHLLALFGKDCMGELNFERTEASFTVKSLLGVVYAPALVDGKFPDWRRIVPAASREQGTMPALDAAQLAAASAALAPLIAKYIGCVPVIINAAGATESVTLQPARIGVEGIDTAFVILMPIRN